MDVRNKRIGENRLLHYVGFNRIYCAQDKLHNWLAGFFEKNLFLNYSNSTRGVQWLKMVIGSANTLNVIRRGVDCITDHTIRSNAAKLGNRIIVRIGKKKMGNHRIGYSLNNSRCNRNLIPRVHDKECRVGP